ncbi:unnamed protein product [Orchesella dallaii]|uniref:O-acyltransferase WSD1 C-terminal domain-containing protein n=1 Tax=Orchesella dallaii TaxID=48710 RepID=A0ABP1RVH1_9HEXA
MAKFHLTSLLNGFKFLVKATVCFFAVYSVFLICLVPLPIILIYRTIFSIGFLIFSKGKYKLVTSPDVVYTCFNSFRNVSNTSFFVYIDGPCDIENLRERLKANILRRDENGNRPYGTFLNSFKERFNLLWLADRSSSIDFDYHIRLFPGWDISTKLLSEYEFFDMASKRIDEEWLENKPKWELLVAPKVTVEEDGKNKICSVVFLKFHHFYLDGISIVQLLRHCIADKPVSELYIDPVKPPIPFVPLRFKIVGILRAIFLEPYEIFETLTVKDSFLSQKCFGETLYGRSKMQISKETMRIIRKSFNCSTQAILHSAFLGSLYKRASSKGLKIPEEFVAASIFAGFPYPNMYPQNRAYFGCRKVKYGGVNPIDRLRTMNKFMRNLQQRHYALKSTLILMKLLGLYPMSVIRFIMECLKPCYFISNVPGVRTNASFNGKNVTKIMGFPPLCNGIGFCGGGGYYEDIYGFGFFVRESDIVNSRADMEKWISEFENEICFLEKAARDLRK